MKPMVKEHNIETDEITAREMTEEEFELWDTQRLINEAELAKSDAERLAKEAARQSALEKLVALGLTEDEIKALAG